MKHLFRIFLFNSFALWLVSQIFPALRITGGWQSLLVAGLTLGLLNLLVKPILVILFIPINLITFGLLSWVINVAVLYLLTILVGTVVIEPWTFPGWEFYGFVIPPLAFSGFFAFILVSLGVSFFVNTLNNLSEG